MSSYSSTSLSSYDPASSESSDLASSPSTSPSTSPIALKKAPSFGPCPSRSQSHPLAAPGPQRTRALTLDVRPQGLGVDPSSLVGKQLTRVRRSRTHPCITLHFADSSAFQVLVVGYDPHHPGVPKLLESDSPILNPCAAHGLADLRLTISHAASITLSDKAFQARSRSGSTAFGKAAIANEDRWTQRHAAFALKFHEEQGWHCVWATMAEYDDKDRERCVFRNYADVYLDKLQAQAQAPNHAHTHAHANAHVSPLSAPAHRTTYARAPTPASPSGTTPASSPHKTPAHHKGKRKNYRKNKSTYGHPGNLSPSSMPGGSTKARW